MASVSPQTSLAKNTEEPKSVDMNGFNFLGLLNQKMGIRSILDFKDQLILQTFYPLKKLYPSKRSSCVQL